MDGGLHRYDRDFFTNSPLSKESVFRNTGLDFLESKLERLRGGKSGFPVELQGGVVNFLESRTNPSVIDAPSGEGKLLDDLNLKLGASAKLLGFDKYPKDGSRLVKEVDLDNGMPIDDAKTDLVVSMYGIRYFRNPIDFLNEAIRVTKPDGFIIVNGIGAMKLQIRENGQSDEVKLFSEWLEEDGEKVQIYNFPSDGDWLIIKVKDPSYRFDLEMTNSYSIFAGSHNVDIRSGARFVYKKKPKNI